MRMYASFISKYSKTYCVLQKYFNIFIIKTVSNQLQAVKEPRPCALSLYNVATAAFNSYNKDTRLIGPAPADAPLTLRYTRLQLSLQFS